MIALLMPTYVDAQVPCSDPGALKHKILPVYPHPLYVNDYTVQTGEECANDWCLAFKFSDFFEEIA